MAGLTAAQKQQFEEDGCLTVEGVLTREEVETLRRACSEVEETAQGPQCTDSGHPSAHSPVRPPRGGHCEGSGVSASAVPRGLYAPPACSTSSNRWSARIFSTITASKLNWKPPLPPDQAAQGWKIGWHQDYAFFPHTNYDLPACAIYLDDTNLENGCMNVIPGSHREGPRNHMKDGAFSGVCQEPDAYADESRWRTVEVPAGGISLHHCLMLHSSGPNHSQRARRTFVIQYRGRPTTCRSQAAPAIWAGAFRSAARTMR